MTAKIIDGKQTAADMRAELKAEVAKLKTKNIVPGLAVILVGEDPASNSYVTAKERACEETGMPAYWLDPRRPRSTTSLGTGLRRCLRHPGETAKYESA